MTNTGVSGKPNDTQKIELHLTIQLIKYETQRSLSKDLRKLPLISLNPDTDKDYSSRKATQLFQRLLSKYPNKEVKQTL